MKSFPPTTLRLVSHLSLKIKTDSDHSTGTWAFPHSCQKLQFSISFFPKTRTFFIVLHSTVKGKGIPITGHEGPRGMWMQVSTYSQPWQQEEVGWLVLCSAAFIPEESPRYSFYRRLSVPQDQSGHEGAKKNLHPSDIWDRTRAVQPLTQRLAT